jgi:signal transduction histidine kinase
MFVSEATPSLDDRLISRQELTAVLDNLPCAIAYYDSQDRLMLWNRQCESLFGVAGALRCGMTLPQMLDEIADAGNFNADTREACIESWLSSAASSGIETFHLALADRRFIEIMLQTTSDGNRIQTITDVTLREQALAAVEAAETSAQASDRLRSEFLSTMSHELRTPLHAVIGFAEALTTEMFGPLGNDNYREYAADIAESGHQLLGLINDIMDATKLEAHQLTLVEDTVDIGAAVRASVRATAVPPHKKSLKIVTQIQEDLPTVLADERRLKQALQKLLSNAVKFTPADGHITVDAALASDGRMALQITDSGIGIEHDQITRIFLPFTQVDGSLSRSRDGVGLGLAIAKGLIELHGGEIELESAPERGTVARLILPRQRILVDP